MISVGDIIEEWMFTVEAGKIREFARAVRDIHGGGEEVIASSTFPVVASAGFVERLITEILKLDRSRTVHGAQQYEYFAPIRAGDRLCCRARMVADEIRTGRRGGRMRVVSIETEFASVATGKIVCRETMTTIQTETNQS